MQEIKQEQIPLIIEKFPLIEEVVNEIRQNSTYGKFCMLYVIINETKSLDNGNHKSFTFSFMMPVEVVLKSHQLVKFRVEWSERYYYHELQYAIKYISRDLDNVILRNVSNIISQHTDIDLVNFKVIDTPYKMAWEIGD